MATLLFSTSLMKSLPLDHAILAHKMVQLVRMCYLEETDTKEFLTLKGESSPTVASFPRQSFLGSRFAAPPPPPPPPPRGCC